MEQIALDIAQKVPQHTPETTQTFRPQPTTKNILDRVIVQKSLALPRPADHTQRNAEAEKDAKQEVERRRWEQIRKASVAVGEKQWKLRAGC